MENNNLRHKSKDVILTKTSMDDDQLNDSESAGNEVESETESEQTFTETLKAAFDQGKASAQETWEEFSKRLNQRYQDTTNLIKSRVDGDRQKVRDALNKYEADFEEAKKSGKDKLASYYEQAKTKLTFIATLEAAFDQGKTSAQETLEEFSKRFNKRYQEAATLVKSRVNGDMTKFREALSKYEADFQDAKKNGKDKLAYYYEQVMNRLIFNESLKAAYEQGRTSAQETWAEFSKRFNQRYQDAATLIKSRVKGDMVKFREAVNKYEADFQDAKKNGKDKLAYYYEQVMNRLIFNETLRAAYDQGKASAQETYEEYSKRFNQRYEDTANLVRSRVSGDIAKFKEAVNKYDADFQEAKKNGKDKLAYYYEQVKNQLTFTETLKAAFEQGKTSAQETWEEFSKRFSQRYPDTAAKVKTHVTDDIEKVKELVSKYEADFQEAKKNGKDKLAYYYEQVMHMLNGTAATSANGKPQAAAKPVVTK